jgi:hypothetical protein
MSCKHQWENYWFTFSFKIHTTASFGQLTIPDPIHGIAFSVGVSEKRMRLQRKL